MLTSAVQSGSLLSYFFKQVVRNGRYANKEHRYPQRLIGALLVNLLCAFLFAPFSVQADESKPLSVLKLDYQVETLAESLKSPWSMIQLNATDWLVTERDGHIVQLKSGKVTRHKIELGDLYVASQGGLLDIIKSPDFSEVGTVFISYAQGDKKANRIVVGRLIFDGTAFSEFEPIFTLAEDKNTAVHYGGRLMLLPDNTLLMTSGDGYDFRERPQVLSSQMGKMLRINLDGSIPADNPYATHEDPNVRAVYSFGHRNPQGLAYDTVQHRIFEHEHGPAGGDEINIIEPNVNYGWPIITYGKDYSGAKISPFTEYPGLRQPVVDWTPSIAPSGMAFYYQETNPLFPELQQHLLVTALAAKKLYAVNTAGEEYVQHQIFEDVSGRLRDVYVAQDGAVVVLTDGDEASLLSISPAENN